MDAILSALAGVMTKENLMTVAFIAIVTVAIWKGIPLLLQKHTEAIKYIADASERNMEKISDSFDRVVGSFNTSTEKTISTLMEHGYKIEKMQVALERHTSEHR